MRDRFHFDPWSDLHSYREAFRQFLEGGWMLPRDLLPSGLNAVVIPIDILDNGTEIIIKAGLPGVKPENVSVSVMEQTLSIKATLVEDEDIRGAIYLQRERRARAFVRSIKLPLPVDASRAEARINNGLLTLLLPKSDNFRPNVIQVNK